jgi:trehalose synthase-fused probable maltokinase
VPWADRVLAGDGALAARLERLAARPLDSRLIRTHGDYHLGQVLWTGTDFVIIDFEGEPARPLALRREKRPALRDVAGMLRSFQYAGSQAVADRLVRAPAAPPEDEVLHAWGRAWTRWAQGAFLRAWLEVASADQALGGPPEETRDLLDLFLVEKACYELAYELNNRPDWVGLPLAGLAELAGPGRTTT